MKKQSVKILISILITLVVLFLFLRKTSFEDIKKGFTALSFFPVFLFIILALIGTILRAIKYNILISNKLSFKDMFLITLVRNFSVDLLPARTASLAFYTYLTNKKGLKTEEGGSSFVIAMFYDVLSLAIMLSFAFLFFSPELNTKIVYFGLSFLFAFSLIIIVFSLQIVQLILKIKFLEKFKKISQILNNILVYLKEHTSLKERLKLLGLSFVIRVIKYVSVFILFIHIVNISFDLKTLSLFSFGIAGTELSSVLPIQGIGGFGTWEVAFKIVFESLKFPVKDPFLVGLVIHVVTQIWEYIIGISAFIYIIMTGKKSKNNPA